MSKNDGVEPRAAEWEIRASCVLAFTNFGADGVAGAEAEAAGETEGAAPDDASP
jgi:hypothetical protein